MFVEKKKKELKKMMNKKNKKQRKIQQYIIKLFLFVKKVTFYLPMKERENRTRLKILFIKIDVE